MAKNYKIVVFIGGGYVYQEKDSIGVVSFDNSLYVPLASIIEYNSINNIGNVIADLFDFYNDYIDKDVLKKFEVEIHLNVKSNIKCYYGKDAITAIDWINNNYSPKLRDFIEL